MWRILVVDGEQGVTQGDATIASYAEQSGRSVIIVVNKWDLAVEAAQAAADESAKSAKGKAKQASEGNPPRREIDKGKLLGRIRKDGEGEVQVFELCADRFSFGEDGRARAEILSADRPGGGGARCGRFPRRNLNRWLKEDVDLQRATNPKARPVRIYYITQAKTAPPVFLLFTNQKKPLHFNFERFLENQLRAKWPFIGTPVRFMQRLKKRGERERATAGEE